MKLTCHDAEVRQEMLTGKVVQFDDVRGYGFIAPEKGGDDVFFHVNVLGDDRYVCGPGLPVEFESTDSDRGPKAISVHIIDKRVEKTGSTPWSVSAATATSAAMAPPVPRPASPVDSPAPALTVATKKVEDTEDELCDVLTASVFSHDLTDQMLDSIPTLTAAQIAALRKTFLAFAKKHNWIED
jgi:CspA family cold shock protein